MSVIENDTLPADLEVEVLADIPEKSLAMFHKLLLVEEDGLPLFYRETTSFADDIPTTTLFGPFEEATDALFGINLI